MLNIKKENARDDKLLAIKVEKEQDEEIETKPKLDLSLDEIVKCENIKIEHGEKKTSNEILAELFGVFNSQPPKELLNDDVLLMKSKQIQDDDDEKSVDKKHKKSKKSKKHKDKDKHDDDKEKKNKDKKKKKKHKHKDDDDEKLLVKIKNEQDEDEKKLIKKKRKLSDKNKHKPSSSSLSSSSATLTVALSLTSGNSGKTIYYDAKPFYGTKTTSTATTKNTKRNDFYDDDEKLSDLSLSDEESYQEESNYNHNNNNNKNNNNDKKSTNPFATRNRQILNSFYEGNTTNRPGYDKYIDDRRTTSRKRRKSRSRSRSRSRSEHKRSHGHDLGIDKKRLLEVARKNAITMLKRGTLPGWSTMSEAVKDRVLMKMRYSGKTIEDLTQFCKKISHGAKLADLQSSTDDDDNDNDDCDFDKNGNPKAFHRKGVKFFENKEPALHHPFSLKEREPIVMQIRNSKAIDRLKPIDDKTKAITMQFPVSSGQQHRLTEGAWTPIKTTTTTPTAAVATPTASTIAPSSTAVTKNVFDKIISQHEQQQPAFCLTVPTTTTTKAAEPDTTTVVATMADMTVVPLPVPPPTTITPPFIPEVPVPSSAMSADPAKTTTTRISMPMTGGAHNDVSTIITNRLSAMRRLQNNPTDSEAIKMMYNSQKEMSCWAQSNQLPGQFLGSTGATVLTPYELGYGPQAWVKRDQLLTTQPLNGGVGMHLLQKMGWKPGEGLGPQRNGALEPLLLDIKMDKKGLVARADRNYNNNNINNNQQQEPPKPAIIYQRQNQRGNKNNYTQIQESDLNNKHPVCLLNEMSAQRRWQPPLYTCINEAGPAHSKMFLFSVSMNGQTYTPPKGSNTKKEAKLLAARFCLQQLNILRSDT